MSSRRRPSPSRAVLTFYAISVCGTGPPSHLPCCATDPPLYHLSSRSSVKPAVAPVPDRMVKDMTLIEAELATARGEEAPRFDALGSFAATVAVVLWPIFETVRVGDFGRHMCHTLNVGEPAAVARRGAYRTFHDHCNSRF